MNADHPRIVKSEKASYLTQLLAGRSQGTPCPGIVQGAVPMAARAVICRLPRAIRSTSKVTNVTISRKPRILAALASPQSSLGLSQYLTGIHRSGPQEVKGGTTACWLRMPSIQRKSPGPAHTHSRGQEVALKRGALKNLWQLDNSHKHPLAYG